MRSSSQLVQLALRCTVLVGLLLQGASASAQERWTVESNTSLAWWQVDPNMAHLWSTTCPADPSWRPGQGRSPGWNINPALAAPRGYANTSDTVDIPLYPRHRVRPLCEQAVSGEIIVADPAHWRGVHGVVKVHADNLVTGEAMRDVMMHQLLQTGSYPDITFKLDSVVDVTKRADTLVGSAVGTMTVRGQERPVVAQMRAWPYGGGMRVLTKWHISAEDLVALAPELHRLGLGVNTRIWKSFFMGSDLVLRREGSAGD
jgi:YceI-like protein